MICETGISYRSWMGLRNIVTTSLLPSPWFVLKHSDFIHYCFCTIIANVSTVGKVINIIGKIVLTSWTCWEDLRHSGVHWPYGQLLPWQNTFSLWQISRVLTCPKSTRLHSSPWMECLSWSSKRRGNSKSCYTWAPLLLWRCPLHRGSLVSEQVSF